MTNEQLRQRAEALAAEHNNDAYSVAMAMLEREANLDSELENEIDTRDTYHEWCDELANEIARFLGVEIGEHSSANNPWLNAYEAIPESLDKIKAEAVREAIAHSAMNDNHKRNSYWAYDVMTKYANKLEQGE